MKTGLRVILALVLGLSAECDLLPAWRRAAMDDGVLYAADCAAPNAGGSTNGIPNRSGPRVVLDKEQHNFGKSDVGVPGSHSFVVTNTGDQPLILTGGKTTCGCCTCVCSVRLPESPLAPGESGHVTLEWKSSLYVGSFRQTATVSTNDPSRREVTLLVIGRFAGPVGVAPSQVSFSSVRLGEPAESEVCVYNYLPEPLEITGYTLLNQQYANCFRVSWKSLSVEELREEGEARGGYRVRLSIQPDLPVGAFQQTILLKTGSKTMPVVEIPVQGAVVSDISIAGRGWNAQAGALTMGIVKSHEGVEWTLLIVARGPHAKDVRLKPVRIVPDSLEVELGSTRYVADTAVSLTPLTIRIRPGSQASTHLGAERGEPGRITLQTNHPLLSELSIQVRFAVSE